MRAIGMLLHSNEQLQISTVADRVIDVHNMWEDSMGGSHTGIPRRMILGRIMYNRQ
jgi:hypothetical protein